MGHKCLTLDLAWRESGRLKADGIQGRRTKSPEGGGTYQSVTQAMDHKPRKGAALSEPLMVLLVHSLTVHGLATLTYTPVCTTLLMRWPCGRYQYLVLGMVRLQYNLNRISVAGTGKCPRFFSPQKIGG